MRSFSWLSLFAISVFLAGCTASSSQPVSTIEAGLLSSAIPTASTPYLPAAVTPTFLPPITQIEPTLPPAFKVECVEILPEIPAGQVPEDDIVLNSMGTITVWDLVHHQGRRVQGEVLPSTAQTSPDGKWLAYEPINVLGSQIIVESPNGKNQTFVTRKPEWFSRNLFWLRNQWLMFADEVDQEKVADVDLANPFTGEVTKLVSVYPNISPYQGGMNDMYHFGVSSVIYNSSLDLVIYPEYIEDRGFFTTLWDRSAKRPLARVFDGGIYHSLPLWLPGQTKFVVVGIPDSNLKTGSYHREWMFVSNDGQVKQLTHFGDNYSDYLLTQGNTSLSPDGRYLTFDFTYYDSDKSVHGYWIILDIMTLAAVDPCLPSVSKPAWTFDSKYLVLGDQDSDDRAILYNIEEGWAAYLANDQIGGPVGWLKKQP